MRKGNVSGGSSSGGSSSGGSTTHTHTRAQASTVAALRNSQKLTHNQLDDSNHTRAGGV